MEWTVKPENKPIIFFVVWSVSLDIRKRSKRAELDENKESQKKKMMLN